MRTKLAMVLIALLMGWLGTQARQAYGDEGYPWYAVPSAAVQIGGMLVSTDNPAYPQVLRFAEREACERVLEDYWQGELPGMDVLCLCMSEND